MLKTRYANLISIRELPKLRRQLPVSWIKAAGLLRNKKKALERHSKKIRNEWDRQPSNA